MTQQSENEEYWKNELKSLWIEPKRKNILNDKDELESLAENIKQIYYQYYKTAYENNEECVGISHFDYII